MDSKKYFVKQVANTIKDNHGKHSESFIFGISGKWGEGKTHFLDQLEEDLVSQTDSKEEKFKIFRINPWKFASDSDSTSFLRNFLKTLAGDLTDTGVKEDLKALDFDTSETNVHWGNLFLIAGAIFIVYMVMQCSDPFKLFIQNWKSLIMLMGIPIFLGIVGNMITVQKSNHAISTIDQFDELLRKIIDAFKSDKKKPVIFVDDLDRVTPEIAHTVLDNLRTFFDKKDITFVVTGDHTVLERYLGKDILPDSNSPEQLEEGRRFLKKIFNIYWRLPLPLEKEIDSFIDKKLKEKDSALDKIFLKEDDKTIFAGYLKKYFSKNYRQIIRFIETTLFTFEIIQSKSGDQDEIQKKYFMEMLDKPLLVVRILMLQELCPPLFDKIVNDQEILLKLEYLVEKKDSVKINEEVTKYGTDMSSGQKSFIEAFLYEDPRFYKGFSLDIADIRPFIFLAADASFGDHRGLSGDDFVSIIDTGDPVQIKNVLASSGDNNLSNYAGVVSTRLPGLGEETRGSILKALMIALAQFPKEYSVHKIFADKLKDVDLNFIVNLAQKFDIVNSFTHWIDLIEEQSIFDGFKNKFDFILNSNDFDNANIIEPGIFTSSLLTRWYRNFYPQNPTDLTNRMLNLFPQLDKPAVQKEMEGMENTFADGLLGENNDLRDKRFEILKYFIPNGITILKEKILKQVYDLNADVTTWAVSKADDSSWKVSEIEGELLKKIEDSVDINVLIQSLNFIIQQNISTPEEIWKRIIPKHIAALSDNIANFINQGFQKIPPPSEYASKFMDMLVDKINASDEAAQEQLIGFLKKNQWPWVNLSKYPLDKKMPDLIKSKNENLRRITGEVFETWGIKNVETKKDIK